MTDEELGSGPIQPEFRESMNTIARNLDILFNAGATGKSRTVGFGLLVFPFGAGDGRCNYISNGADRRDIIKLLREQANRFDEGTV